MNPGVFFLLNNFFELNPGIFFLLNNFLNWILKIFFWIENWIESFLTVFFWIKNWIESFSSEIQSLIESPNCTSQGYSRRESLSFLCCGLRRDREIENKFSWSSEKKWPQFSREFSRSRYLAGLCQQSYRTQSKHGYNTTKPRQLRADATIPHIWDFCRKFAGHLGQIFRIWWLLTLKDCRISKAKKSGVRCI